MILVLTKQKAAVSNFTVQDDHILNSSGDFNASYLVNLLFKSRIYIPVANDVSTRGQQSLCPLITGRHVKADKLNNGLPLWAAWGFPITVFEHQVYSVPLFLLKITRSFMAKYNTFMNQIQLWWLHVTLQLSQNKIIGFVACFTLVFIYFPQIITTTSASEMSSTVLCAWVSLLN